MASHRIIVKHILFNSRAKVKALLAARDQVEPTTVMQSFSMKICFTQFNIFALHTFLLPRVLSPIPGDLDLDLALVRCLTCCFRNPGRVSESSLAHACSPSALLRSGVDRLRRRPCVLDFRQKRYVCLL